MKNYLIYIRTYVGGLITSNGWATLGGVIGAVIILLVILLIITVILLCCFISRRSKS